MRKSVFSLTLVLLLLAGLVVATGTAGAQPTEVRIYPYEDGWTYDIYPGQVGVVWAGWAACSPGLVRTWIGASNHELTLDEVTILTPEDGDELWSAIEIFESPPPFAPYCVGTGRPAMANWQYVLDGLAPGVYSLGSRIWIDHPLIDGADFDGDRRPDLLTPEEWYWATVNTVIIHSGE
jgi:hypothetical protein